MNILLIFLLSMSLCPSSYQLLQNEFTYRYSRYVTSDFAINCGWKCQCPPYNEGNLCNCQQDSHNNGKEFTIESPYAAILVQKFCPGRHRVKQEMKDVSVNMAAVENKPIFEYDIETSHKLLSKIKLMPKADYYVKFDRSTTTNGKFKRVLFEELSEQAHRSEKLVVIIPGWQSYLDQLHSAYSNRFAPEVNGVIVVDWTHSNQLYIDPFKERVYDQAVANTVYVGIKLGILLWKMKELNYFNSVHIIGFDIGSHIAHFTAKYAKEREDSGYGDDRELVIDRITALDPPRYLFENDGLSSVDAKYVDVYHSNTVFSYGTTMDIVRNLIHRNFGHDKKLGHDDIFINLVQANEFAGRHEHPQCEKSEAADEPPIYGCHSIMAARFFLDSSFPPQITYPLYGRSYPVGHLAEKRVLGKMAITYKNDLCTIMDESDLSDKITTFLTRKEYDTYILPRERLSGQREKLVPSSDVDLIYDVDVSNEKSQNCGKIIEEQTNSGRVWEGRNVTSDENYFPWMACIKQESYSLLKYKTILINDKLYRLPKKLEPSLIRRSESLTGLEEFVHYVLYPGFKQLCTGSLIGDRWIITAGHCFETTVNGQPLRIVLGMNDCGSDEDEEEEEEEIDAFHHNENNRRKNVFINFGYEQTWDREINEWINLISHHGTVATNEDVEKLLKWENDPYEKMENYSYPNPVQNINNCKKIRYVSEEIRPDDDNNAFNNDIALIRISKQGAMNRINSICFLSSKSFDYNNFNQSFYMAGFGSKGHKYYDGEYLSWLTGLNEYEIDVRYKNNLTFGPRKLYDVEQVDSFLLSNVDFVNGSPVTSSTCPGDSGGPAFIYGRNDDGQPIALLVGTLIGRDGYREIGDIGIIRGDSDNKNYKECAMGFAYNVYAKKIFTTGSRYTKVSIYADWIRMITTRN